MGYEPSCSGCPAKALSGACGRTLYLPLVRASVGAGASSGGVHLRLGWVYPRVLAEGPVASDDGDREVAGAGEAGEDLG